MITKERRKITDMGNNALYFYVFGYDSRSRNYDLLFGVPDLNLADDICSAIVKSGFNIHRLDTTKPYDFLIVSKTQDPQTEHKIYSRYHPCGFKPNAYGPDAGRT